MLNIQRFTCNMLQENCYVASDETLECVIIDCGAYFPEEHQAIFNFIETHHLKPIKLIATHGHFDHNMGNAELLTKYGLKVNVCIEDQWLIEDLEHQIQAMMGATVSGLSAPVGHYFSADEMVCFGSHAFSIIPTPGHTPGSCVFYCKEENVAFTGDTLFCGSMGRTDFEGGSSTQMRESLHCLSKLPVETTIYCGHGPQTTIASELKHNPYL